MQKHFVFVFIMMVFTAAQAQQTFCNGKDYPEQRFSPETRAKLEEQLAAAEAAYNNDVTNADSIIWYARRKAYLGFYDEAIAILKQGERLYPKDARFLRHSGHRYITIRCFDKAITDLTKAASLVKGKKDEVEPDGMPNAQNIPTSTLQSNIWYHLGLAYFLKKDFKKAEDAYKECLKVSTNPDMYVATANWYYITLRELKKEKEAAELLATINKDLKLIENTDYLTILLLYKQQQDPEELKEKLFFSTGNNSLSNATLGFGLGNYYWLGGEKEKAKEIFKKITAGTQWGSFAYMTAEMRVE
jgi:tetratricopeptide (TPR) repeat protein